MGARKPARSSALSEQHEKELEALLMRSARECGFAADEWTFMRVHAVVELRYRVTLSTPGIWRMLERLGFRHERETGWRRDPRAGPT